MKNPLAAEISLIGNPDSQDIRLGQTVFSVLHKKDGLALIAGALLNDAGEKIGMVSIDGFPLNDLPSVKSPGRPPAIEKRMAIFLAWALKAAEFGGKFGEADQQIVDSKWFKSGCSEAGKVRKVRNVIAKKIGIDLDVDVLYVSNTECSDETPPPCSVLIEKPTFYLKKSGGLEILGIGYGWVIGMGERVISKRAFKFSVEQVEKTVDFEAWKKKGRPIIISIFQPGQ